MIRAAVSLQKTTKGISSTGIANFSAAVRKRTNGKVKFQSIHHDSHIIPFVIAFRAFHTSTSQPFSQSTPSTLILHNPFLLSESGVKMPSPPPRVRQAGLVAITGYEELSSLFSELQARPDLAKQIRAVEYSPDEDTRKEPQCAADITYVLNQITQRSQLEYFKWTDPYRSSKDDLTRPEAFWMALANAAGTLKHLSLTFATHELHRLSPMVSFP